MEYFYRQIVINFTNKISPTISIGKHQHKYFVDIYWEMIVGKGLKKKKVQRHVIYINSITNGINSSINLFLIFKREFEL